MGVFGNNIPSNKIALTEEEIFKLYEGYAVLEKLQDIIESEDILTEDVESNYEAKKALDISKDRLKTYKKEIKRYIKEEDYKEAMKIAEKAKEEFQKLKSDLDKLDWSDSGSKGAWIRFTIDLGHMFIAGLLLGPFAMYAQLFFSMQKDAEYLHNHKELGKDYNQLRIRVYRILDKNIEFIDKLIEQIKRREGK